MKKVILASLALMFVASVAMAQNFPVAEVAVGCSMIDVVKGPTQIASGGNGSIAFNFSPLLAAVGDLGVYSAAPSLTAIHTRRARSSPTSIGTEWFRSRRSCLEGLTPPRRHRTILAQPTPMHLALAEGRFRARPQPEIRAPTAVVVLSLRHNRQRHG
jgi:hypothetical protein